MKELGGVEADAESGVHLHVLSHGSSAFSREERKATMIDLEQGARLGRSPFPEHLRPQSSMRRVRASMALGDEGSVGVIDVRGRRLSR